jgi:protein SCO1
MSAYVPCLASGARRPTATGPVRTSGATRVVRLFLGLLLSGGLLLNACRRAEPVAAEPGDDRVRHPIRGQIVSVDQERRTLLVDHEEIPGYMPPMVMEFVVSTGDLALAREGQRIRGELVQESDGTFLLEKIWPIDPANEARLSAAAAALRQDTTIRGRKVYREVGENLPSFALYDQEGRVVTAERFRGRQMMINFIYSRCPIATMCPAAVEQFTSIQREAREAGIDNLELISITLDPEYDTPGVLKEYAQIRGIDTSNYSFLTGPESAIKDLLQQFGVLAFMEGSLLQHTLATLLIDPQGRIVHRADGTRWDRQDFLRRMKR